MPAFQIMTSYSTEPLALSSAPALETLPSQRQHPSDFSRKINPALKYLETLSSENSRITMASKLNVVARMVGASDLLTCDWSTLRAEHVLSVMKRLEEPAPGEKKHGPATVNCYLSALKGVAKAAWLAGLMGHEIYLRIQAVRQRRFHRLPTGRSLSFSESRQLINACETDSPKGARDRAILLLMLGCGLRRGEIPPLLLEHYSAADRSLTLIGKGNKERRVFLPDQAASALGHWVRDFRGSAPGRLFGRIYKNGRISLSKPLAARSVGDILAERMADVDSPCDDWGNKPKTTSHDLRRTFATRLLDENIDIVTVKNMMGHASVTTTAQYDRRGENAQREAANRVRI